MISVLDGRLIFWRPLKMSNWRKRYTMIFWIIATLAAFYIKGLCGFANTLVLTSILSFGAANINISPVELLLGYPTNLIISWKERKSMGQKRKRSWGSLAGIWAITGQGLWRNMRRNCKRIPPTSSCSRGCGITITAHGWRPRLRRPSTMPGSWRFSGEPTSTSGGNHLTSGGIIWPLG